MNKFVRFFLLSFSTFLLAFLTAQIGRNIIGSFFPEIVAAGWFDIITPGIVEGYIFMFLFFLPALFIPVYQNKAWYGLVFPPVLLLWPFVFIWKIVLLGITFFIVGVGVGYGARWLKEHL